ncbi:MAG: XTP/dITP diphosphatase [Nitrospiraceae bacterium]
MTELVLATRNHHKGSELAAILGDMGVKIRTLAEFPDVPEVVEDGETCRANAIKKAETVARVTGLPSVADDTGLMVEALGGRPGVYAARYAGETATYEDNWRKLLRELAGVPLAQRQARFITVAAMARPGTERVEVVEGELKGLIAEAPAGTQGFGYDPVFFVPELGKTLAQLTPEEKNRVSHRARAFAKIRELFARELRS